MNFVGIDKRHVQWVTLGVREINHRDESFLNDSLRIQDLLLPHSPHDDIQSESMDHSNVSFFFALMKENISPFTCSKSQSVLLPRWIQWDSMELSNVLVFGIDSDSFLLVQDLLLSYFSIFSPHDGLKWDAFVGSTN